MLYEIKDRGGKVIWRAETETLKEAIEAAIKQRADLRGAYLQRADLQGADLRGAALQGAALQGAALQRADLRGAYLQRADLQGADLRGAALQGAKGINKYLTSPVYLLMDQPGWIHAYKLVNASGSGPFRGGINYEIGATYEVDNADTDEAVECGAGISLATLDWCIREWKEGYRILIAEFTAVDIAAIPIGSDGKFRVHRCRIVGEKDLEDLGLVKEGV